MPFQLPRTLPDFSKLKSTLLGSKTLTKNYLLYQTIINFLDSTTKLKDIFNKRITDLEGGVTDNTEVIDEQIHIFLLMGG